MGKAHFLLQHTDEALNWVFEVQGFQSKFSANFSGLDCGTVYRQPRKVMKTLHG